MNAPKPDVSQTWPLASASQTTSGESFSACATLPSGLAIHVKGSDTLTQPETGNSLTIARPSALVRGCPSATAKAGGSQRELID